jgi:hypothetical protein
MSHENPTNEEEWKLFRFPTRVVREPEPPSEEEGGDEGEGEGSGGGPSLTPDLPPPPAWEYCESTGFLKNVGLGKKIDLDHLNETSKVVRLLSVFELRPDLAFASLRRALEAASQARFQKSLEQVLKDYADGRSIPWKDRPTSFPGMG